jgi:TRAP-type C4-dicarboxylate transport system substrate-binding protein
MNGIKRIIPLRRLTRQRISPAWFMSSLALVLTLLAGCMPIQPTASNEAVTLRFAVSDGEGHPTIDPYVYEFVDQVHTLSQGKITLEVVWEAGNGTFDGGEKGTLQRVLQGKYDLGLVASRTWDSENITNFQALQAPFLINNDALAAVVASGAIGKRMLDSLTAVGLVGLTLWPEDLRHPFSVVPDKPLLSPADFVGLNVRAAPSDVTYQIIEALGAMPVSEDGRYEGAESGLLQGGTLTGKPVATGNVTFYPKFQVIFANADLFNRLSDDQRMTLRQAATAVQTKAIAEHPQEVDAATAYCADGGTIVLATDEQVAAFEQAVQPVFDNLQKDSFNAELITAIRELKAQTI